MAKTRLQEKYLSEAVKGMMDKFNYKNVMEIPKIEKVVINMGIGEAVANSKALDSAVADLTLIAGQRPVITKAKKSIAAFKLRQGMPIGTKVTLRGDRMYYFLDKLMNIALPRVRDFRGVNPTAFDGRGNYALGMKEQLISRKLNMIRSIKSVEWISSLLLPLRLTRKPENYSDSSECRSAHK